MGHAELTQPTTFTEEPEAGWHYGTPAIYPTSWAEGPEDVQESGALSLECPLHWGNLTGNLISWWRITKAALSTPLGWLGVPGTQ